MRFGAARTLSRNLKGIGTNTLVAVPYAQTFGVRARILTEFVRMPCIMGKHWQCALTWEDVSVQAQNYWRIARVALVANMTGT